MRAGISYSHWSGKLRNSLRERETDSERERQTGSEPKTCLPKWSRNWLGIQSEYLKVSVAQKLTDLRFFRFSSCLLLLFKSKSLKINFRGLVWKNSFIKLFRKFIKHYFWVLSVSVAQKISYVFFLAQTLSEL